MITASLPDIKQFTFERPVLSHNAIIRANSAHPYYYPEHKTPFLLIANCTGAGHYILNKQPIATTPRSFYFTNSEDSLEIRFSTKSRLQTLFILFADNFIKECIGYSNNTPYQLIDHPEILGNREIVFPNVPFEQGQTMRTQLMRLQEQTLCTEDINDILCSLLIGFLTRVNDTNRKIDEIGAIKRSTREELYRRLFMAREFMHDQVYENCRLNEIAKAVCLNKFHFLESFKALYKTTPHRYFRELKLQKAYELLKHDQVITVCNLLGFESTGTFSNVFKKRFGISPSEVARRSEH